MSAGNRGLYLYDRIYADLPCEAQYVVPFCLQDPLVHEDNEKVKTKSFSSDQQVHRWRDYPLDKIP